MYGRILLAVLLAIPLLFSSGQPAPFHFIDIAQQSGLTIANTYGGNASHYILETTGNGAAIFDFDEDGANDIFIASGTVIGTTAGAHAQLYRNDGRGHFTDVSTRAGLTRTGWAQAACVGDFDNDGHPDLFVTYYGHNSLYHNQGNGTFVDVSEKAGLPVTGTRWGSGCAFLDYDHDGYLDIFVANYIDFDLSHAPPPDQAQTCDWKGLRVMCGPHGLPQGHNALFHNNRDGTFTDVSDGAGILKPGGRYGLGVAVADFDNDGWPDIYVACDQSPSLLYHNQHDGTFTEVGDVAGVAYNADGRLQAGMGVAVGDFDGNGFLDIAKTNFSGDRPSLYRNENGTFFEDISESAGLGRNQLLGWGIAFLDADEDGRPDLVLANGHIYPEVDRSPIGEKYRQRTLLYRNLGRGRFEDVTPVAGPAFSVPRPARGLAIGDLDGDGRPEIVIVNMNEKPSLLKNTGARQNSVSVTLHGTISNRSAIGARCQIEVNGQKQIAEVTSGGSYYSQNSLSLYFGVGNAQKIESLEVRWPNSGVHRWSNLPVNRTLEITENSEAIHTIAWKR